MAVAFDANLGSTDAGAGTLTVTLTTSSAAAALTRIVVFVSYFSSSALTSGVTVAGTPMVMDKRVSNGSDRFEIWSVHSAAGVSISASIIVTWAATTGLGGRLIGAASFTGVLSSGALDTTSSATATGTGWASGSATNANADALFVGGAGNETAGSTTSTAVNGLEIHDRWRSADGQGFASGYTLAGTIASRSISGTWSTSSTATTGALVIYSGISSPVVAPDPLDPQIQWTDDFGPGDFGPYPFQDDSAFSTNTPSGGGAVTFVMDAIASASAAGIAPTVRARATPPVAAAIAAAASPTLRAIVKPVIAAVAAAGLVPTARTRTAPPVAVATAAGLTPAKLTATVTAAGSAATAAGLVPRPAVRPAPPVGSATAAGQVPNSMLVVHAVTATALAAAGAPIEPGGGGTGAAPQWIGLRGMDEQTAAVYAHGRRRRI